VAFLFFSGKKSLKYGLLHLIDGDHLGSCHFYPPNRRAFYIKNPFLPKATPLERKELWISIEDLRARAAKTNP
jgi:hypothetical protein